MDDLKKLSYLERAKALYELASQTGDEQVRALLNAAGGDLEELGSDGLDADLEDIEIEFIPGATLH
jgi:hypothetical protein